MKIINLFSLFFLSSISLLLSSLCTRSFWSVGNMPMKELSSKFKTICVYAGTNPGKNPSYQKAAIELGKQLVEKKINLVYGGGNVGLMGFVAQTVHDGGRHVLGIIPRPLMTRELTGNNVGEVKVVTTMHQRKSEMIRHADAFIALPGGYGTMEEVLEAVTWAQIGIHRKPVGLLNVDGYYNFLLSFVDNAVKQGFMSPISRDILVSAPTVKQLIRKLEDYIPKYDDFTKTMVWEESCSAVVNSTIS